MLSFADHRNNSIIKTASTTSLLKPYSTNNIGGEGEAVRGWQILFLGKHSQATAFLVSQLSVSYSLQHQRGEERAEF